MDRIDTVGATAGNQFTEGNPIAGVPATVLGDVYLNDVQEELLAVIESAGLTPTKGVQTQILEAVLALVANEINVALGREVSVVAPSDLALGDPFIVEELFGLAKTAVLSGAIVTMVRLGPWAVTKTTPQTWLQGETVYWDTVAKEATTDGATGTRKRIGLAYAAAASGDTSAVVLLTGESVPTVVN